MKPNISRFDGSSVHFDDGSVIEDVDLVVGWVFFLFCSLLRGFVTQASRLPCRCSPQVTSFLSRSWLLMSSQCLRTKRLSTRMFFLQNWTTPAWLSSAWCSHWDPRCPSLRCRPDGQRSSLKVILVQRSRNASGFFFFFHTLLLFKPNLSKFTIFSLFNRLCQPSPGCCNAQRY